MLTKRKKLNKRICMRMRIILIILGIILLLAGIGLAVLSHPAFGLWRHMSKERIQASPNYRDGMFRNQEPTPQFTGDTASMRGTLWHFLTNKDTLRVPQQPIPAVKTDLKSLPTDSDWLVWFGHSSYLFCLNGKRYLVDPVLKPEWPATLMMKPFAGTDIYRPEDLPEIDVLIITHEHWDHMEYATLRDIRDRVKHVICPLGIADYLRYWDYEDEIITEMDWYDQSPRTNDQLQITCLPSRHFSNRLLGKRNQTLWASFMVESGGRTSEQLIWRCWKTGSTTPIGNISTPRRKTSKRLSWTSKPSRSSPSTMTSSLFPSIPGTNRTTWHTTLQPNIISGYWTPR